MTGVFQSKQRKDFSVEEHDNLSKISISKYQEPVCVQIWHFQLFSKYQRHHLSFCKASTFSLFFEILFAFFTNMRSSIYLLSHAAPKHGFKSWKSPQRHLGYSWKWHLTKSFYLRGEIGNFQRFPVSVFVHKHSSEVKAC